MLAAGAGGPRRIEANVFGANFDVDILRLGQHRHRCRRGMDAPARLGCRHALNAVDPGLKLEPGEDSLPGNLGNDFLVSTGLAVALRKDIDLPAVIIGITRIHPEKIAGEESRLAAAGSCPDFENGAFLVGGVLGQAGRLADRASIRRFGAPRPRFRSSARAAISGSSRSADRPSRSGFRLAEVLNRLIDRGKFGPLATEFDHGVAVDRLRQPWSISSNRATSALILSLGSMAGF